MTLKSTDSRKASSSASSPRISRSEAMLISIVSTFLAIGCGIQIESVTLQSAEDRGELPTHRVVLDQKLQIFDGCALSTFEDRREVPGVWHKIFDGFGRS